MTFLEFCDRHFWPLFWLVVLLIFSLPWVNFDYNFGRGPKDGDKGGAA